MTPLVHLQELKGQADTKRASDQTNEVAVPPGIIQLRHRLVNGACADSLDVKIAIVGELVWLCYLESMKRRYL